MVRAPKKTCPSLYRVFDGAQTEQVIEFLQQSEFARHGWIRDYLADHAGPDARHQFLAMLNAEKKDRLEPLEKEAARVLRVQDRRGQVALADLARAKLGPAQLEEFRNQKDDLARSLWTYLQHRLLFEAVESVLHLRLYRRYGKHYQAFAVDAGPSGVTVAEDVVDALIEDIEARLELGAGCTVERFDLHGDGDEPASEMFIIYHPNPWTSAREIQEDGERRTIYFRPPGEATVVHTPAESTIRVRADTRALRQQVAESFAQTVLKQDLSSRPLEFRDYDLSRFFSGFVLDCPDLAGFTIRSARVIKAEVSIGDLRNRLALTTTIDQDIDLLIDRQPGLRRAFEGAVAIRFLEIAVRYVATGESEERTLDFTISDSNSCSLQGLPDERERVLGHRLLRHWGVLHELRTMTRKETAETLPTLLELWDSAVREIPGAWLISRGIEPTQLTETGFLAPVGWADVDLVEDDDGLADADLIAEGGRAHHSVSQGEVTQAGAAARYRKLKVNEGWLVEHLRDSLSDVLDEPHLEQLSEDLFALGALDVDDVDVPVYLARRLNHERVLADSDQRLRARSERGIGLVLSAVDVEYRCLAANVLTPLTAHVHTSAGQLLLDPGSMRAAFRSNRHLARGGQSVEFVWDGGETGELFIPGKGTAQIVGRTRLKIVERLYNAFKRGSPAVRTKELNHDLGGIAIRNIFGQAHWSRLHGCFIRNGGYGLWELAV